MRRWAWVGIVTFALLLTGCIVSRHPAGISASSTPLNATYTVLGPAEDSSCRYYLLAVVPLGGMDESDEIIGRMVKERGGDGLINVIVEVRNAYFPLPVASSTCTIVTGKVVKNTR